MRRRVKLECTETDRKLRTGGGRKEADLVNQIGSGREVLQES